MDLIKLESVSRTYRLGKIDVKAIKEIDLTIEEGEFVSLAGPSGSGKSTVLNLIGVLDRPTAGKVRMLGEDVSAMSDCRRAKVRLERVGFVFQNFNLLPVLTVYENVEYPLILAGLSQRARDQRVNDALEAVGLQDRRNHKPDELSGGQRQRVSIGRALVAQPCIVLADEPTANLDSAMGNEILDLMQTLNREKNVTFIFASHDPSIIRRASRVIKMRDGRLDN